MVVILDGIGNYLKIIKNLSHTSKLPYNQISNNYSIMSMIQNNSNFQYSIILFILQNMKYFNNLSENLQYLYHVIQNY